MREFGNNTNARLPVLFLLDASSSMNGIIRGDNQPVSYTHLTLPTNSLV